jgi:hypothetical protein
MWELGLFMRWVRLARGGGPRNIRDFGNFKARMLLIQMRRRFSVAVSLEPNQIVCENGKDLLRFGEEGIKPTR